MIKTGKIAHESLGNKPPSNCQTQCKVKTNSRLPRQSTRVSFGVQKSLAESKLKLDSNCLRYTGYAQERVLVLDDKGQRIVMIGSGSSRHQLRKLQQVLSLVNNHLSSPEIPLRRLLCCKSFLFIGHAKQILGCVIAEPIHYAHRVTPSKSQDNSAVFCSLDKVTAHCGISRIWVEPSHRGKGIATKLLDAVCRWFVYGQQLQRKSIAFSQPTGDGKSLAVHYTGISEFLVYPEEAGLLQIDV
ncbi:N-acetyltransferase eso1 [Umbelopsis sp. WA50703]